MHTAHSIQHPDPVTWLNFQLNFGRSDFYIIYGVKYSMLSVINFSQK